jgi:hypothetical protein
MIIQIIMKNPLSMQRVFHYMVNLRYEIKLNQNSSALFFD